MSDPQAQTYTLDMHIADTLRSLEHFAADLDQPRDEHARMMAKIELTELVRRIRGDTEQLQDAVASFRKSWVRAEARIQDLKAELEQYDAVRELDKPAKEQE